MKMKEFPVFILGLVIVSGNLAINFMVASGKVVISDPNQSLMVGSVISNMAGLAGLVVGYYFGSTKNSGEKTDALNSLVSKTISPSIQTTTTTTEPSTTTTTTAPSVDQQNGVKPNGA
jgi:hypothetical protein